MSPRRVSSYGNKPRSLWLLAIAATTFGAGCSQPEGTEIAAFDYAAAGMHRSCDPGKVGAAGATNGLKSGDGVRYNVRTPSNYDGTFAHPLLMVYAAGGASASSTESLTHLTSEATRNGFVVAYASHRPVSEEWVRNFAKLPGEIAANWCVDLQRVYATGHSDGGTVATALALLDTTKGTLAGIAPSAAGFSKEAFATFKCPSSPLPVMVMHSKEDMLFRGWGADAAKWWAACNGCDMAKPPQATGGACVAYQDCAAGGQTRYCEGTGTHREWPDLGEEIISFSQSSGGGAAAVTTRRTLAEDIAFSMCRASLGADKVRHENTSASIGPEFRP